MITQDDIDAMADDQPKSRDYYLHDPIFQRMQWEVRRAYESGYRAAGGGKEWRDHWMQSDSRKFLVANGLMTGNEGYK